MGIPRRKPLIGRDLEYVWNAVYDAYNAIEEAMHVLSIPDPSFHDSRL